MANPQAAVAWLAAPGTLATGQADDVFLCPSFLVHAASWPDVGQRSRIIAQPDVALHDSFPPVSPLSPVEFAMTALADSAPGQEACRGQARATLGLGTPGPNTRAPRASRCAAIARAAVS
jgi:hypothetical protein